jgi:hypothetical protein
MEAAIETLAPPDVVWRAWEKAHAVHADGPIEQGQRAKRSGFKYKIIDVVPGERFSISWKGLFVKMVFTHTVKAARRGSEIRYAAELKGIFAWPVRLLLKNKIRKNLAFVLKEFTKQLESQIKA